ncbi:GTPase activating protein (GAP) for Rho1p [Malassezia cuniculi]|uniref:GTPase activating protein (GAP) for Rho1p n=1 Tax=Malassezia cuniculi TaxID=948313 RepID=A0AAF0EPZ4_9BASI|nr:GTPase activating protein (GAP) for Rho1p [Malassezia cuniculi]
MASAPYTDDIYTSRTQKAWWNTLGRQRSHQRDSARPRDHSIFGARLQDALKYSSVAISLADKNGDPYIWGYVPVIVAKIGRYLKHNATNVEGVFRIGGSEKRMKELTEVFDTPPAFGRNVDWSRYSVHDAASLFRRYLNQMPEPIVPLDLYTEFRNVITSDRFEKKNAVRTYRLLITSCPPANQYLLLYVLDLLAVFAHKSDVNRMSAENLAIIFQPGMLSHPSMLQSKDEHLVAVRVLEFLIMNQQDFVMALSPPAPPNLRPEELTVSRPVISDVTICPSDSDEELGEVVAHIGGGAYLQQTGRMPSLNRGVSKDETSLIKKTSLSRSNTAPTRRKRDGPRKRDFSGSASRPKEILTPKPVDAVLPAAAESSWTERLPAHANAKSHSDAEDQDKSGVQHLDSPRVLANALSRSPRLSFLSPGALAHGLGQVPGLFRTSSRSPRSDRPDPLAQAGEALAWESRTPTAGTGAALAPAPATATAPATAPAASNDATPTLSRPVISPAQARTPSLTLQSVDNVSPESSVAPEREGTQGLGLVVEPRVVDKSLPELPAYLSARGNSGNTVVHSAIEKERPRTSHITHVFPVDPTVAHLGPVAR